MVLGYFGIILFAKIFALLWILGIAMSDVEKEKKDFGGPLNSV